MLCLVVRDEPLLARPVADGVPDRVAEVGRQPAFLDLEHLVPAPGLVEAERRAGGRLRERVLELVPVVERRGGGEDRLERGVGETADPDECVAHLRFLRGDLDGVVEILEAAAAAGRVVGARGLDALGRRLQHLRRERLGEAALHLRHASADAVAGEPAPDEDDEAVQAGDAVAAVGEGVDLELDLLVQLDGRGHRPRVAVSLAEADLARRRAGAGSREARRAGRRRCTPSGPRRSGRPDGRARRGAESDRGPAPARTGRRRRSRFRARRSSRRTRRGAAPSRNATASS